METKMNRVVAYLRVSTDEQENDNQKFGVDEFCKRKELEITEYVRDIITGTSDIADRNFGSVFNSLTSGDVIVVSEMSRLSRTLFGTFEIIKHCVKTGISLYTVKEGYQLTNDVQSQMIAMMFGFTAQIERDRISQRVKETYSRKKRESDGKMEKVDWGRKVGSIKRREKLDPYRDTILSLLKSKTPKKDIAAAIGTNRVTLNNYLNDLKAML